MKSIIKTNQPEVGHGIAIFDPTIDKPFITKFTHPIGSKGHIRDQFLFNSLWDAMIPYIRKFGKLFVDIIL